MSSTPPSNSTSSIEGSWSDCAENDGETTCGSVCCATGQYCTKEDQCVNFTPTGCDPSNEQCSIGAAQSAAASFSTSTTYPSAAAISSISTSSFLPTTTTLSSSETSSLIASASEISSTVGSSTVTSTNADSTAIPLSSTSLATTTPTGITRNAEQPTSTSTPSTSPTASPSTSTTSKVPIEASVPIAVVALIVMIIALIYYCRRRNRPRNSVRIPTGENSGDVGAFRPADYGPDEPPVPHPYTEAFPQHQSPTPTLAPMRLNRSQFNADLTPDHDTGNLPPPTNFRHSPALNPYNRSFPSASTRGGLPGDGESTISTRPPTYRSRRL